MSPTAFLALSASERVAGMARFSSDSLEDQAAWAEAQPTKAAARAAVIIRAELARRAAVPCTCPKCAA